MVRHGRGSTFRPNYFLNDRAPLESPKTPPYTNTKKSGLLVGTAVLKGLT